MKKACYLLLLLCLICLCSFFAAFAEGDYAFDPDTGTITEYSGGGGEVIIPAEIDGITVKVLGYGLFSDNNDVTSVIVPEGVIEIEGSAFYGCKNLTLVQLPQTLATLGDGVFSMCESLVEVNLPEALKRIPSDTFYFCTSLASITLPEGIESIGQSAFNNCESLQTLSIPAGVGYIGTSAFSSIDNLAVVDFFGELPYLGFDVFWWAWDEETVQVTVPAGLSSVYGDALEVACVERTEAAPVIDWTPSEEELIFDASTGTITGYVGSRPRLDIPQSIQGVAVAAIGEGAFMHDTNVHIIQLPEGITSIGSEAFMGSLLERINLPQSLESIGEEAFLWSRLCGVVTIPEKVRNIPDRAFKGNSIEEAFFSSGIESIGEEAFSLCYSLEYLFFDAYELPEIAPDAFNRANILDVDIHQSATKTQEDAARETLEAIGISTNVWRANLPDQPPYPEAGGLYVEFDEETRLIVGYTGAMTELTPFWNWYVEDELVAVSGLGEGAFAGSEIRRFTVPRNNQFAIIGDRAFEGSELERIDLFDSITTIGVGAFRDCANLTEVILPESIEVIGAGAFENCVNLKTLMIPTTAEYTEESFAGVPFDVVRVHEDTSDETITKLNAMLNRPANRPVLREGEAYNIAAMPDTFIPNPESDFDFDPETGTIMYVGKDVHVVIPREIGGVPVRIVGDNAFSIYNMSADYDAKMYEKIQSVVIPETVVEIGANAFVECANLQSVICYGELEKIGLRAFENNVSLREVIFYNGVMRIDQYAFNYAASLTAIDFGPFLDSVGEGAFHASGLETIIADIRVIGPQAFWGCENLREVHITSRVEQIETGAFLQCASLETMCIEKAPSGIFGSSYGIFSDTPDTLKMFFPSATAEEEIESIGRALRENFFTGTVERCDCERPTDREPIDISATVYQKLIDSYVPEDDTQTQEPGKRFSDTKRGITFGEMSSEEPQTTEAPGKTGNAGDGGFTDILYVVTEAVASGISVPIEQLGRYDVIFHADGTCVITIGGMEMPSCAWTEEDGTVTADYFGVSFVFERTEDGLVMDYYGTLLLTYQPE